MALIKSGPFLFSSGDNLLHKIPWIDVQNTRKKSQPAKAFTWMAQQGEIERQRRRRKENERRRETSALNKDQGRRAKRTLQKTGEVWTGGQCWKRKGKRGLENGLPQHGTHAEHSGFCRSGLRWPRDHSVASLGTFVHIFLGRHLMLKRFQFNALLELHLNAQIWVALGAVVGFSLLSSP